MIGSIALMLLGAAAAQRRARVSPASSWTRATITSAQMVPEGPAPARGGGRGRGGAAAEAQAPRGGGAANAAPPQANAGARGGGNAPAPAMIPAHCRVQIVLKPSSDSLINMEIWLPPADKWNGKFMGVGNGGFAGSIQGLANEMPQALRLGYATAGTDTGHQEQGGAWAIGHPEKMIDFGYRATHEMTLKSKQIVKAFYDRSARYLLLQGLLHRRPDGADGSPEIPGRLRRHHRRLAGEPSHPHVDGRQSREASIWSRHPERGITAEQAALVNNLVMNKCDTLKEGFLNNPRACKVDFSTLKCAGRKAPRTPA